MGRPPAGASARETPITARFSANEAENVARQATLRGFSDKSSYLRHLVRQDGQKLQAEKGK